MFYILISILKGRDCVGGGHKERDRESHDIKNA